jgi:hypothetical protein
VDAVAVWRHWKAIQLHGGIEMGNRETAEKMANDILDFVNSYGFDQETFAKTIAKGHKTLQQSVMRLFLETIKEMSMVPPDARNEATVELAKVITAEAEKWSLPFI